MSLVNDQMMPRDPRQNTRFSLNIFESRQKHLEFSSLDTVQQKLSLFLVTFENDRLYSWSPFLRFGGPIGDGRERDEDEERSHFSLLLDEVGNECECLDGFSKTLFETDESITGAAVTAPFWLYNSNQ